MTYKPPCSGYADICDCPKPDIIELEKFKMGIRERLDRVSPALECDIAVECVADRIEFLVRWHVWNKKLDTYTYSRPKTWWDAFKEEYFPPWALKRWPVIFVTTTIEARVLYPDLRLYDNEPYIVRFDKAE